MSTESDVTGDLRLLWTQLWMARCLGDGPGLPCVQDWLEEQARAIRDRQHADE